MLVKLRINQCKLESYNNRIRECKKEYPDFSLEEIHDLTDIFIPYIQIPKALDWTRYTVLEQDYKKDTEFDGVYVCHLNANHDIENLTDYKEVKNFESPIYWCNYGVADNASQVLNYYDKLVEKHFEYMNDRKFVILLTPIFKEDQPKNGGWRWHKWGQYIGKYNPQCEYLYDEDGIDYVYVFNILEIDE